MFIPISFFVFLENAQYGIYKQKSTTSIWVNSRLKIFLKFSLDFPNKELGTNQGEMQSGNNSIPYTRSFLVLPREALLNLKKNSKKDGKAKDNKGKKKRKRERRRK